MASRILKIGERPEITLRVVATERGLRAIDLWEAAPPGLESGGSNEGGRAREFLKRAEDELRGYFRGERTAFSVPLDLDDAGTRFERRIWRLLRRIPYGWTRSYGDLAAAAAAPGSARAVGRAVGRNPLAIVVPCHRVVGRGGNLTGFASGLALKVALLELEGIRVVRRGPDPANWKVAPGQRADRHPEAIPVLGSRYSLPQ